MQEVIGGVAGATLAGFAVFGLGVALTHYSSQLVGRDIHERKQERQVSSSE
jgi:hypothetical protein